MGGGEETTLDGRIDAIARVCHEANRGLQAAMPSVAVPVSPAWDDVDEEMRESVRIGVGGVLDGNSPEESHELWCATRRGQGWTHGEVKDAEALTHPCLVPYEQLPPEQRVKDELFAAVVRAVAPVVGLESASEREEPLAVALRALAALCDADDASMYPEAVVRAASTLLQEARWDAEERSDAQWRAEVIEEVREMVAEGVSSARAQAAMLVEARLADRNKPGGGRPPLD